MDKSRATASGLEGATTGLLVCGPVVAALHKFHAGFRKNVGASGKVALVISPAIFLAAVYSEHEIHNQQRANWRAQVLSSQRQRSEIDQSLAQRKT